MKKTILIRSVLVLVCLLFCTVVSAKKPNINSYQVTVTGRGQPMLFIPGATCSGEVWKETVSRYENNYQCHVFTLAGYAGIAPVEQQPYLDNYEKQIGDYIEKNRLKKVILVGHSIGGFLALRIATKIKDRLEKLVIVDALPFYAAMPNPSAKDGFNKAQAEAMFNSYNKMDNNSLKASQFVVAKTLCADSTKWEKIANWGASSDRKTMAYTMCEMLGHDIRESLALIKIPVLVMAAFAPVAAYPLFTQEYVVAGYKQQYQKCKTCEIKVAPSSKHFIMYDAPEWFYQEIDAFIKAD